MSTRKLAAAVLVGALALSGGAALAQVHGGDTAGDSADKPTSQPEVVVSEAEQKTGGAEVPGGTDVNEGTQDGSKETADEGTEDGVTDPGGGGGTVQPNHGQIVSVVARTTPGGPGKGQIVSEAARTKTPKTPKPEDGDEATGGSGSAGKRNR